MKTLVITLLMLLAVPVMAQNYDATIGVTSKNATHFTITVSWDMPKEDAQYYNQRFGTDALEQKFDQLIKKEVRNRISSEKTNDWNRWKQYAPESMKETLEQIEADSAAARAARAAQEVGSLEYMGPALAYGKSFSQVWNDVWEEGGGGGAPVSGHAPGLGADLAKAGLVVIAVAGLSAIGIYTIVRWILGYRFHKP